MMKNITEYICFVFDILTKFLPNKKSANYKICVRKENSTKKRFSAKNYCRKNIEKKKKVTKLYRF